jgi:hypothetical protein
VIPTGAASGATEVSDVIAAKPDGIFADAASQVTELVQALRAAHRDTPVISVYSSLGYAGFMQLAYLSRPL